MNLRNKLPVRGRGCNDRPSMLFRSFPAATGAGRGRRSTVPAAAFPRPPGPGYAPAVIAVTALTLAAVAVAAGARAPLRRCSTRPVRPATAARDTERSFFARRGRPTGGRLRHLGRLSPRGAVAPAGVPGRRAHRLAAGVHRGRWRCRSLDDVRGVRPPRSPRRAPLRCRVAPGGCGAAPMLLSPLSPSALVAILAIDTRDRLVARTCTTSWTAATASPRRWRSSASARTRIARAACRATPVRAVRSRSPQRRCRSSPSTARRASMFMGDVGAVPLGFLAAALGVAGALTRYLAGVVSGAGVPAVHRRRHGDARKARSAAGARLADAHREHYYQRLAPDGRRPSRDAGVVWRGDGSPPRRAALACLALAPGGAGRSWRSPAS